MKSTYMRVLPRDLFNEAKLLKCLGRVALLVGDELLPPGVQITIEEHGQPFQIERLVDGELTVANYACKVNGQAVTFATAYNSKSAYPLYCTHGDNESEVFDEEGQFTVDFIEFARSLR